MPTFQFEAMDATGHEIKDVIEAPTEEEAQATIRQMGYFVTKISVEEGPQKGRGRKERKKKRGFAIRRRQVARCSPPSRGSFRFCKTPVCRFCAACEFWKARQRPGRLRTR